MKPEISAFCPRSGAGAIKARANAHAMPPTTGILRLGIPNYTAESATRTPILGDLARGGLLQQAAAPNGQPAAPAFRHSDIPCTCLPHSAHSRDPGKVIFERVTAMTPTQNRIQDPLLQINPEAVASFHDDGVVILDNRKGRLYSSGPAGAYIWRGIEQRLSAGSHRRRTPCRFPGRTDHGPESHGPIYAIIMHSGPNP